ncbi:MAG: SPW repeat protein [Acidobacteriaceae bacterium]|nr:SPW repeat protein [Acidobacteriaceae bacterium]
MDMTSDERTGDSTPAVNARMPDVNGRLGGIRAASTICLLAGIWLFVSPWVYGAYTHGNAWNSWILGAAIFLLACVRVSRPAYSTGISWVNLVLGIWVFFSPWIYGYLGNTGRFINSLCVGVVVFAFSLASGVVATKLTRMPARHA